MEYPRARVASVVSLATEADMMDLIKEPPIIKIVRIGTIIHRALLSGKPETRVTSP